jgi:signal transduction histidine kinase
MKAPLPHNEEERLQALHRYEILDTDPEKEFDDLTLLASHICGAPIALISLVDEDRQWFKSKVGSTETETSRDVAFCAHGILQAEVFVVQDAQADQRFANNPLVTGNSRIRFYAGAPLIAPDAHALGMLCVNDQVPRDLSSEQRTALQALSRQVVSLLELRRSLLELRHTVTQLKSAETELEKVHEQLLEASRRSGMAEIATNVIHNVGNVLNSANISATLAADMVKNSGASGLVKVVELMQEHATDLGAFVTFDPRGKLLPAYLTQLSESLITNQDRAGQELDSLRGNIEHIKEIVNMQQGYAKVSGVKEIVNVLRLVEDSLRMNVNAFGRHGVELVREFAEVPPINIDKHKALQILVNLIHNAMHACEDSERADKQVTVRVSHGEAWVDISVLDNGVGIPHENRTRIFNHGFTTRKDGHGFGLHSGALAAKEMGGSLTAHSDGRGLGATFTLKLPCQPLNHSHE